ncbi:MMPL family transporter [Halostella salina]|uniref:MMPL family transporter n=1 Tax=Halostella salina TaxID=1547897 RepID=UPI001F089223|nr:MMPL family transporter [Halostella salina]
MSATGRIASAITDHSRIVIVVMLLLTAGVGAGAVDVQQSSSITDQFDTGSVEEEKLSYVQQNFTAGRENTTTVQVIVRNEDGNVLSRESLVRSLRFQQSLRANESINETLAEQNAIVGIENYVASFGLLRANARSLQAANESLQENITALEERQAALNATSTRLQDAATAAARGETTADAAFDGVRENSSVTLTDEDGETFSRAVELLRSAETESDRRAAYALATYAGPGNESVLSDQYAALQERSAEIEARGDELAERAAALEEQRAGIQAGDLPPLRQQTVAIEAMNESEVDTVVESLLSDGGNGGSGGPLGFMSADYEPGSTNASARMMIVFQSTESGTANPASVSDRVSSSQLLIQDQATDTSENGEEYVVFGFGVISEETSQSMNDSLAIVGPLALLFVLLTLLIAYRDIVDIALGFVGIFTVLIWTFGFMGWADITFNQIMIAVPVLLIGLSIDYAIHIFMRHREQRQDRSTNGDETVRGSMRTALLGVGVALVWVTATTVIGFMSNLISPLGPIQDFGIVSSFGIAVALLVFGAFVPALKVEIDSLLEGWGLDRKKRAFGTGGGGFSAVLSVGAKAAKAAPLVVIVLALTISVAGAYGATQVDTSFSNEDFIADDPPDYMYDLPEPFKPGEYSVKQNLEYINDNFQREDQTGQILIEGNVTNPDTLNRVQRAEDRVAESEVAYVGSSGEPSVTSPNSVIQEVAARNETMAAVVNDTDTDGDGVPDRNLTAVYDTLYEVTPDQATSVVYREGGEYRALQIEVSVKGGLSTAETTERLRDAAAAVDDDGDSDVWTATATGTPVVNEIVQGELLTTVIDSLIITLVAVFAFLMVAYRVTEGSATLGVVTLLPVALSVAWILGTMYLIGMPFNVLTGMITSLTVGLGVAYSIHLSERYNLELERRGDVWEAMRTSVTGTGGALLGSAATTVGGFGVLALAIFPALQQFGIITGLTIVYAFIASVVVLPSLLVVWTKYLSPDDVPGLDESGDATPDDEDGDDSDDDSEDDGISGDSDDEGPDPLAGSPDDDESVVATDETVDPLTASTGADADADDGSPTPDGTPAAAAGGAMADDEDAGTEADEAADEPSPATRTVYPETVAPGDEFSVSVDVDGVSGRVVLVEDAPGVGGEITTLDPSPESVTQVGRTVYAAWELDGPTDLHVAYTADAPADATAGEDLSFDGELRTADGAHRTGEADALPVVSEFLERVRERSAPTTADVNRAAELAAAGDLTEAELERIHERWLAASERQAPPSRADGGED